MSSGIRVVPCGQADMAKLTVAFHNFGNAPKYRYYRFVCCLFAKSVGSLEVQCVTRIVNVMGSKTARFLSFILLI